MGWLDEQIKQRIENDNQVFQDSFYNMACSVTGQKNFTNLFEQTEDSIKTILKYYHCTVKDEIPASITDFYEQLTYLCGKVGVAYRDVKLTQGWYKDAIGALLAFDQVTGNPIVLLPDLVGYKFLQNGKYVKVNKNNVSRISKNAICFYRPFPNKKLTFIDLIKYSIQTVPIKGIVGMLVMMLVTTLVGLIAPKLSNFLYGTVVESQSTILLISTMTFYLCLTVSQMLFSVFQTMFNTIVTSNMSLSIASATMMRMLSLPPNFYRNYSAGEISERSGYLSNLCTSLIGLILNTGFTSLFSLAYIGSIVEFAPGLVVPSIIIILVSVVTSIITTLLQIKISKQKMELSAKESGVTFSMITGVRKIKLAGAEKRVFARWSEKFAKNVKLNYNPPFYIKFSAVINLIVSTVGTIVMYFFAIKTNVSLSEYYAFTTAYGMVFGAFSGLAGMTLNIAQIKPVYEMAKPLMDEVPEQYEGKDTVTKLNGTIEFNNVSFGYDPSMPLIVDNLSLKIKPGQYVAIVGKTGCGKSTLVRLLLGFEKPYKGSIYYDGHDIKGLDLKSLRRKIGVVMQDGKLFQGEIFSNIAVCAPSLTIDEAFKVADIAGIGDDIRNMPMGMNTYITEGGGSISGGQKQRLLIARALAPKPNVLILDEATSALDNITQKKISEALDKLHCTRIVIAHRLFTIKHCDRIIYLEDGKIKEDGTYDELIAKNGLFADLVKRQMLDQDS